MGKSQNFVLLDLLRSRQQLKSKQILQTASICLSKCFASRAKQVLKHSVSTNLKLDQRDKCCICFGQNQTQLFMLWALSDKQLIHSKILDSFRNSENIFRTEKIIFWREATIPVKSSRCQSPCACYETIGNPLVASSSDTACVLFPPSDYYDLN